MYSLTNDFDWIFFWPEVLLNSVPVQIRALRIRREFFSRLTQPTFLGQSVADELNRLNMIERNLLAIWAR